MFANSQFCFNFAARNKGIDNTTFKIIKHGES
jgi:hypothetical protein